MRVRDGTEGRPTLDERSSRARARAPTGPPRILSLMTDDPVLVRIELTFRSNESENVDALADRVRESVGSVVGREAMEEFRVRTLPLVERKSKGGLRPVD